MPNRESTPTTSIDTNAEFDGIIAANYEYTPSVEDMPIYADARLHDDEFDSIVSFYDTTEAPEVTYDATPVDADGPAMGTPEYERETEALRQRMKTDKWYRRVGAQAGLLWQNQIDFRRNQDFKFEKLRPNESDSKAKLYAKAMGRHAIEYGGIVLGVGVLGGIFAARLMAAKHGIDMPHSSASVADGTVTTPLEAAPAPAPAAANILVPAPSPAPVITHDVVPHINDTHTWTPPAHAKVHVLEGGNIPAGKKIALVTGGATHPDAQFEIDTLIANGTIDPNTTQIIPIHYPAEMGPFVGQTPTAVSAEIGAQAIEDAAKQYPGANITSYAFSEGNFPQNIAAHRLADQGINIHPVGYGDGNSQAGLLSNPLATGPIKGLLDQFQLYYTPPADGSVSIFDGNDFYASNAGRDPAQIFAQFAENPEEYMKAHRMPGPNEPRVQIWTLNGVRTEVVGTPVPVPEGAQMISGPFIPGGPPAPNTLPPNLLPPAPNMPPAPDVPPAPLPDPNIPPVPDTVPDMSQLPPPPPDPVGDWLKSILPPPPAPAPDPNLVPAA